MSTNQLLSTRRASKQAIILKKSFQNNIEPQTDIKLTLNNDRLIVIDIDSGDKDRVTTVLSDPRIISAEIFNSNGSSQLAPNLYRPRANLNFTFPGNQELAEIKVYQLNWNGQDFDRNLLGQVSLP